MSGLFLVTLLLGVFAMSLGETDEMTLEERASFYGIPIPDFIFSFPIFGPLLNQTSTLLTSTGSNIFGPALEIVSFFTGGLLSRDSSIFKFLDDVSGKALSAISGAGGLGAPKLDTGALLAILSNAAQSLGSSSNSILAPLFAFLNIPGNAFGTVLKQLLPAIQGIIPTIKFGADVNGTAQSGSIGPLLAAFNITG